MFLLRKHGQLLEKYNQAKQDVVNYHDQNQEMVFQMKQAIQGLSSLRTKLDVYKKTRCFEGSQQVYIN